MLRGVFLFKLNSDNRIASLENQVYKSPLRIGHTPIDDYSQQQQQKIL